MLPAGVHIVTANRHNNPNWRDQLTAVDGVAITYDQIGNPLNDGTWQYEWVNGRQLARIYSIDIDASFVYNENGLRVQKTVNGVVTKYTLHGKNVMHMTRGNDSLHFFYDAQNRPAVVVYNGTAYAYVKNLQGDIIAILNSSGTAVVSYTYDAWGAPVVTDGTMKDTLGVLNPFRYRGYVFDEETQLYYLRSRYYNPTLCRFINADVICQSNQYAYCKNIVVSCVDGDGKSTEGLFAAAHWWRLFDLLDVGWYKSGKTNIATNAVRFAYGVGFTDPPGSDSEGTHPNALRHFMWVGMMSREYGDDFAREVAYSHEDGNVLDAVDEIIGLPLCEIANYRFESRSIADGVCDMLNNEIALSLDFSGKTNVEICSTAVYTFYSDGLWMINDDASSDGFYITLQKIDYHQFSTAMEILTRLDENGYEQ